MLLTYGQRKLLFGAVIALLTAIFANAAFFFNMFEGLELKTFDIRARYFSKDNHPSKDIAIVLIDEASLRAMNPVVGRWPWPRSLQADLIDFLVLSGAKAVLFDILFTENERVPGAPPGTLSPNDGRLIESSAAADNVYHAAQIVIDEEDEYNRALLNRPLPDDFVKAFSIKTKGFPATPHNNYYIPFPELYRASKGIGVVEFLSDGDGIYRRTKLIRHYRGSYFPVLSIAPLIGILKPDYLEQSKNKLILAGSGVSEPHVSIPIQEDGTYLINMYGDFKPYSMSGVLASIQKIKMGELEGLPISPDEFRDKVVFVGASAVGVEDLKATPLGSRTPGVFLHASIYSNMVKKDFLKYASPWVAITSILFLSFATAFAILWSRRTVYQLGIPFVLAFIYIFISFWWFKKSVVFDMVAPVISIICSWMGTFAYLSFTEGKDKRKIRKMLGQYVSPSILAAIVDKSKKDALKAEVGSKEKLTILFSDIRGFTTMSEALEAEKVVELLNSYLSSMVDVIFKHDGTLDKFIGDAIMAFWGAPIKVDDHGIRAVETALEMIRRLDELNRENEAKGLSRFFIGIGINTGDVILGNIGSERKLDYTAIGDNVNLASRTEGLTKEYGRPILITEATFHEVKDAIVCRVVDVVRVKGKKKGIRIYEPFGKINELSDTQRKVVSLTEEGFNLYLNREWDRARDAYLELSSLQPDDTLGKIFIKRCEDYMIEGPPEEWEGVYTMKSK